MPKMVKGTGVYLITNRLNRKRYVGSTSSGSIAKRWRHHVRSLETGTHHSCHLQNAWNKYGPSAFVFSVALECPPEQCLYWEQKYIDFFRAADPDCGYNRCPTAHSTLGLKFTEEKRLQRQTAFATEEHRRKVREGIKRARQSADYVERSRLASGTKECRAKKSESGKRDWADPGQRAMRCAMIREIMSRPEVRAKIADSNRGQKRSPETCARVKAAKSKTSEETRRRMSTSAKARRARERLERGDKCQK